MTETHATEPIAAYDDAPSLLPEIRWVAVKSRSARDAMDREFWLRKAAVFDRIAIKEAAAGTPDAAVNTAAAAAASAARQLVEYDTVHAGMSLRGTDTVTDEDCREYVRQEYSTWRSAGQQHF
ncbi:hypothetical protein AB0A70_22700 [Streptomyces morookaense]|uniref:hypothetical protein n=1 Tax=Streptomyces morookaense TaxID=1970 RepID=UPI00340B141A